MTASLARSELKWQDEISMNMTSEQTNKQKINEETNKNDRSFHIYTQKLLSRVFNGS